VPVLVKAKPELAHVEYNALNLSEGVSDGRTMAEPDGTVLVGGAGAERCQSTE
jgi:hypothetical protein